MQGLQPLHRRLPVANREVLPVPHAHPKYFLPLRLSVSGILGLCIEVDLGCRWVGETPSRAARCLGPQARWIARCAVSRSGWECPGSGFDSNPPYKKLCFTGETRILASRLSVSGILGLCIEVDPVVHEPCIPCDGVACEVKCGASPFLVCCECREWRGRGWRRRAEGFGSRLFRASTGSPRGAPQARVLVEDNRRWGLLL